MFDETVKRVAERLYVDAVRACAEDVAAGRVERINEEIAAALANGCVDLAITFARTFHEREQFGLRLSTGK